jgi:2'-5' RNA ligase
VPHFVVVLPTEPLVVGEGFPAERWPPHVTLIPSFRSQKHVVDIESAIRSAPAPGFNALVGEEEMFGPDSSIVVNIVVDESGALAVLHNRLLTILEEQCGVTLDDPHYSRDGYRPHITATCEAHAEPGALIHLNQVALVDMEPLDNGDPTVVATTSRTTISD